MKGKHSKSQRLGLGEFQHKRGFNVSRIEPGLDRDGPTTGRLHKEALFLQAVFEVEPEVQDSLEAILAKLLKQTVDGDVPRIPPKKLQAWCSRWHLNAPWCLEAAEQLIWKWWLESQAGGEKYSSEALRERAAAQERAAQPFQDQRLKIEFGFWPITQLTRKRFREECERILEREFNAFCDGIESQAKLAGMERTREKRELDYFRWLARRLVKGESAAHIHRFSANLGKTSGRAIRKAIANLARELELPLRPD